MSELNITSIPRGETTIPVDSYLGRLADALVSFCAACRPILASLPDHPVAGPGAWDGIEDTMRRLPLARLRVERGAFGEAIDAELAAHVAYASVTPRSQFPETCPPHLQALAAKTDEAYGAEFPRGGGIGLRRAVTPWCPLQSLAHGRADGHSAEPVLAGQCPLDARAHLLKAFGDPSVLAVLNAVDTSRLGSYAAELARLRALVVMP